MLSFHKHPLFFWIVIVLFQVKSGFAVAGEVLAAVVESEGNDYQVSLKMRIDTPLKAVYSQLTDYARIEELSETVTESTVLKSQHPHYRVKIVSEGCAWIFCETVTQVQDVTELPDYRIEIDVDPSLSDLIQSQQVWQLESKGNSTIVRYDATIVPDFWVPAMIGRTVFENLLLEEGINILHQIEDREKR